MAHKRSFLRSREGKEDFAEISWTRRAIEVVEGARGTPGKSRDRIFKSEAEVGEAVHSETQRLIDAGYNEYTTDVSLRLEPAEDVAQAAEKNHRRVCAVPVFSQDGAESSRSHRGGIPWLPASDPWPTCGSCSKPFRFVMQISLQDLNNVPSPLPRDGLLQFFACDSDCYYKNGWEAFSGTNLVRVISAAQGQLAALPKAVTDDPDFVVPERAIERWDVVPDLPGPTDLTALLDVDFDTALEGWELLKEKGLTNRWEKVGGWPSWVQHQEDVTCRKCGTAPMTYAMQLEATLQALRVLHGNCLYVMSCASCGEMTAVQQR